MPLVRYVCFGRKYDVRNPSIINDFDKGQISCVNGATVSDDSEGSKRPLDPLDRQLVVSPYGCCKKFVFFNT